MNLFLSESRILLVHFKCLLNWSINLLVILTYFQRREFKIGRKKNDIFHRYYYIIDCISQLLWSIVLSQFCRCDVWYPCFWGLWGKFHLCLCFSFSEVHVILSVSSENLSSPSPLYVAVHFICSWKETYYWIYNLSWSQDDLILKFIFLVRFAKNVFTIKVLELTLIGHIF